MYESIRKFMRHFYQNWSNSKLCVIFLPKTGQSEMLKSFLPKLVEFEIACDVPIKTGLIRKCMLHFYQNWSIQINQFWYDWTSFGRNVMVE